MIEDLKEDMEYVEFVHIVEVCGEVMLTVFSVFMFIICNVGLSVYHAVMREDENASYFLLNVFYQQIAWIIQCISLVFLLRVSKQSFPCKIILLDSLCRL